MTNIGKEAERKIAETAYCLRVKGYYGSEGKAAAAFLKRKGMEGYDAKTVKDALAIALQIIEESKKLVETFLKKCNTRFHYRLEESQFEEGVRFMNTTLLDEFPDQQETIHYMIGMFWYMPRLR